MLKVSVIASNEIIEINAVLEMSKGIYNPRVPGTYGWVKNHNLPGAYGWAKKNNCQPCKHDNCSVCHGTGIRKDGTSCVHMISCPCPKCSPRM
jgi:hypothetical protein